MSKRKFGSEKRYADVLTILLVIIIIAIIGLLGYFGYKIVDRKHTETVASDALEEFYKNTPKRTELPEEKEPEEVGEPEEESGGSLSDLIDHDKETENMAPSTPSTTNNVKKTYLDNKYEIKGAISIPKTNCNYPILEKVTTDSLKKSVAILDIVSSGEIVKDLNVPGTNAFILGHNYINGLFFSNNYKLTIGDTILITDQTGLTVTYTIYDMYYTTSDDASFMERELDPNVREIALQTCNDDSSQRLIIQAKDK